MDPAAPARLPSDCDSRWRIRVDWPAILAAAVALWGAVTGSLSLWLHWKRHRSEERERGPRAVLHIADVERSDGWHAGVLSIRNNLGVPIRIAQISVRSPKWIVIARPERGGPDASTAADTLSVSWEVRSGARGSSWSSSRTQIFVGASPHSAPGSGFPVETTLSIRLTAQEIAESRRQFTIDVTSNPVRMAKQATTDESEIQAASRSISPSLRLLRQGLHRR